MIYTLSVDNEIRIIYHHELNKGLDSKFPQGYWL